MICMKNKRNKILYQNKVKAKLFKVGSTFLLTKSLAFLSPLLLVKFVSLTEFGFLEFGFATGSTISRFSLLGLSTSYPYFILKKNEVTRESFFYIYPIFLLFFVILAIALFLVGIIAKMFFVVFLFTALLSLQMLYSSILQAKDKSFIAVIFDGGYYYVLSLYILLSLLFKDVSLNLLYAMMSIYIIGLCMFGSVMYFRKAKNSFLKNFRENYKDIIKYGVITSVGSALVYFLTCCSRIFIAHFLGYESVGIFSVYFRYMGITQALFSFLYITFFKRLYLMDSKSLDKYYSLVFVALIIICICTIPLANIIIPLINKEISPINYRVLFLLAIYMPIWAILSYVEGIVYRENIASKLIRNLFVILCVFTLALWAFSSILNLDLYCLCFVCIVGLALISLLNELKNVNVAFIKTKSLVAFSLIIIIMLYFII